jgi:hypothetical protein
MIRRNRPRSQARPTARARRVREAAERDAALRAEGIDPETWEREQAARRDERGSRSQGEARPIPLPRPRMTLKRLLLIATTLVLAIVVIGSVLLWQRVSAFNASVSTRPML